MITCRVYINALDKHCVSVLSASKIIFENNFSFFSGKIFLKRTCWEVFSCRVYWCHLLGWLGWEETFSQWPFCQVPPTLSTELFCHISLDCFVKCPVLNQFNFSMKTCPLWKLFYGKLFISLLRLVWSNKFELLAPARDIILSFELFEWLFWIFCPAREMSNSFNKLLIALAFFDSTFIIFVLFDYTVVRGVY